MFPRNTYEHDDPDGAADPTCDLKWSADCDNRGVHHVNPEYACQACYALCERCQQHEWKYQVATVKGEQRICERCATLERHVA